MMWLTNSQFEVVNNSDFWAITLNHRFQTPLLNAARNGHDEIVAYLLQFSEVSTQLERQLENVYSASVSYSYMYTYIGLQCHKHACTLHMSCMQNT